MKNENSARTLRKEARRYIQLGYAPVPIPLAKKAPKLRGWQKLQMSQDDVERYFARQGNIGLLCGEPSLGLTDVDLDTAEAVAVAPYFLPPTNMIHGRPSKRSSHWWYLAPSPSPPMKFTGVLGKCSVEIRSTGQQTVVPPSVHPSGETVQWEKKGSPKEVDGKELIRATRLVAAAALLVPLWREPGTRHDTALAAAGMLLQSEWSIEQVSRFVEAVARAAGDEEWKDRIRDVTSTERRLAREEPVTGANRLKELLGDEVVSRLQMLLELSGVRFSSETPERSRKC